MRRVELSVLVLSNFNGRDANVIRDYLYSFNRHSRHRFYYLHSWKNNQFVRLLNFNFDRFDVIVLFWDYPWLVADDQSNRHYVPPWVADRIANSSVLKVMFLQDEYRDVRQANDAMRRFGVNVMFTCVAEKDHDIFYPKASIPSLKATYSVLTGYVPNYLENVHCPASTERPIDIGYRSRRVPFCLGALGQEKCIIADRFQKIAAANGFRADISVREEDRIYGDNWLTFMRSCRFSLATESGASVVDFDGTIRNNCNEFLRRHPDASFEEAKHRFFSDVDGKLCVQTISPRIFETSAFENTLIMHEGHYEGMLDPDVDYIPVKKDYSNIADVVARMRDESYCKQLARNAKEKLILSKKYNYAAFVRRFDEIVEAHVTTPSGAKPSRSVFYFINYLSNDRLAPRGDALIRIPHVFDYLVIEDRTTQSLLVSAYSALEMIAFLSEAPHLQALTVNVIREQARQSGHSLIGFLKDLRILAILRLYRQSKIALPGLPFEIAVMPRGQCLHLCSNPLDSNAADFCGDYSLVVLEKERAFLDVAISTFSKCELIWDHHKVGDSLLLPIPWTLNCDVFLNTEGIWRFEALNSVLRECDPDERRAVLLETLFPNQRRSSVVKSALTGGQLIWSLGLLGARKTIGMLRRMVASRPRASKMQRQCLDESAVR